MELDPSAEIESLAQLTVPSLFNTLVTFVANRDSAVKRTDAQGTVLTEDWGRLPNAGKNAVTVPVGAV